MRIRFLIVCFILFFGAVIVLAQQEEDLCPGIVEEALLTLGDNCGNLGRNSVCYGYRRVDATFATTQTPGYFSTPADRVGVDELETLHTGPLDMLAKEWGVAVMNVQANVPNTLPGQDVTFLLLGNTTLASAVSPNAAFKPVDGLDVQLRSGQTLHSYPTAAANILAELPAGTLLRADGLNPDKSWVRVVVDQQVGWLPVSQIEGDMSTLPVISASSRTPMQAFYFSTGVGEPFCSQAQSVVAIQAPSRMTIDLTVNGVDIRVGSMITLQWVSSGQFNLTVHEGQVETVDGLKIPAGQTIEAKLDGQGRVIGWGALRPATDSENELGLLVESGFVSVGLPASISAVVQQTESPQAPLIHTVSSGETLFRIAQRYQTSIPSIMQANGLTDPRGIFVGQQLTIPEPGSGFVGLPPEVSTVSTIAPTITAPTTSAAGDCSLFRATSPVGGSVPHEGGWFYWDPAAGATSYRLTILAGGSTVMSAEIVGETRAFVQAGALGQSTSYTWNVTALNNGQTLCTTSTASFTREAPDPFTASWACGPSGTFTVIFNWSNANSNSLITFFFDQNGSPTTIAVSGASGTYQHFTGGQSVSGGTASTSGSPVVTLPGFLSCP